MARLVGVLLLVGLFAAAGCERKGDGHGKSAPEKVTTEDVKKDVGQAVKTVTEYSEQAKEKFIAKLDKQMDDLDAQIAKLQKQGTEMTGDAKEEWDKKVNDLIAKRDVLKDKMKQAKEATREKWDEVQKNAESAWEDLERSIKGMKEGK